jgi:hypothetical protein
MAESKEKDGFPPQISTNSQEKDSFCPKVFTTQPKNHKRRKNKNTIFEDSTVKRQLFSIERELGLEGLLEGKLVKQTVRIPFNLKEAFKRECRANGTSTCKIAIELQTVWLIKERMQKTALGCTMSKMIDANFNIGEVNFTQSVQSRVRRYNHNVEPTTFTADGLPTCQIGECHNEAVDMGIFLPTGKKYRICKFHSENCLANPKMWRIPK